jgi:hypothetical protein
LIDGLYIEMSKQTAMRLNGYHATNTYGGFNIEVKNCHIKELTNSNPTVNDGIKVQQYDGIKIHHNRVELANNHLDPHNDCVQLFSCKDFSITENILTNITTQVLNHHILMIERCAGDNLIANNTMYDTMAGLYAAAVHVGNRKDPVYHGRYRIVNNTIISSSSAVLNFNDLDNSEVRNNILINRWNGGIIYDMQDTTGTVFSHNLYVYSGSTLANSAYNAYVLANDSFSQKVADAGLVNIPSNFQLEAHSPAINAGKDLATMFTYDLIGTTRPQAGAWDIGAYERLAGADMVSPLAPTGLTLTQP